MVHDVEFRVNEGDCKGKVYGYTLATNNGVKMWGVTPQFRPAPSMIKEKIEMVIVAREMNIPQSGAVELQGVTQIINELSSIASETDVTLKGLDHQERPILIDRDGFSIIVVANELTRSSEYRVNITVWGLFKVD